MLDERLYLSKVERTAESVRNACFGLDMPLLTVLPPHLKNQDKKKKAKQIAAQITFALAKTPEGKHATLDDLERCRQWLRTTIFYLLEKCDEESHTYAKMKRLMMLPKTAREIIFREFWGLNSSIVMEKESPELMKDLDLAIVWMLKANNKFDSAAALHDEIRSLLSSKPEDS